MSDIYTQNWVAKSDFVRHINKLAASSRHERNHEIKMEVKIYCEAGAMTSEVRSLKSNPKVKLIGFPFEMKNKRVYKATQPSELTCDSDLITADNTEIKVSDTVKSEKFELIAQVIGASNFNDIRHIDTAYKENCKFFISNDKNDIINNAVELENITGIKFFHPNEIEEIKKIILEI